MPYEIHASESYCLDAGWFYCLAAGIGEWDEDRFEAAVAGTSIDDREAAITHLVTPQLAALGFQPDEWTVFEVTEDYLDYGGFPLAFGDYYVGFDADAVTREDGAALPASKTIHFKRPAQKLMTKLDWSDWGTVTLVWMERLERPAEDEDEE
jgi:hypothetical protein